MFCFPFLSHRWNRTLRSSDDEIAQVWIQLQVGLQLFSQIFPRKQDFPCSKTHNDLSYKIHKTKLFHVFEKNPQKWWSVISVSFSNSVAFSKISMKSQITCLGFQILYENVLNWQILDQKGILNGCTCGKTAESILEWLSWESFPNNIVFVL